MNISKIGDKVYHRDRKLNGTIVEVLPDPYIEFEDKVHYLLRVKMEDSGLVTEWYEDLCDILSRCLCAECNSTYTTAPDEQYDYLCAECRNKRA